MLLEEFDVKKYERSLREEGREEGIAVGLSKGESIGLNKGIDRMNQLTKYLLKAGRLDDLAKAVEDPEYRDKLFKEFGL